MSATDRIPAVNREHKIAGGHPRESLQDLDGLIRKRDGVLDTVFRPLAGKRPKPGVKADFLPFQFRNFAKPLTGQDQKFDEPGIDRFKCVRALPDGPQLVIG